MPKPVYDHINHPARKAARGAARAAARIAPGFDFDTPAEPLKANDFAALVAELEREFPRSAPAPALPVADYQYTPDSYLAELLRAEGARLVLLTKLHAKRVRYDKNRPEEYADQCSYTWSAPHLAQLALADATAEARFVAREIFRTVDWNRPWHINPMTDEGVEKVVAFVAQVAKRIAPFCTPGNYDLFGM